MLRAVFFGTPGFAVASLDALLAGGARVGLVVTQPDRPVSRHGVPQPSAVADRALRAGAPVEKPSRLRDAEFLAKLRRAAPDVGVVVAYGRILPSEVLEVPRLGFVNVHASLLPRHRGASPVAAALLAGDAETGVVTMRVVEELDAGPIYLEKRVAIAPRETAGELSARLAADGAGLLVGTLRGLEAGTLPARPQTGPATRTSLLTRELGAVDWSRPAEEIERRLRAFTPWPGLHAFLEGERIKLLALDPAPPAPGREPGALWIEDGLARVGAGAGTSLAVLRVQRAGGKPVRGSELVRSLPGPDPRFELLRPAGE